MSLRVMSNRQLAIVCVVYVLANAASILLFHYFMIEAIVCAVLTLLLVWVLLAPVKKRML